jgi:hypothetical protein
MMPSAETGSLLRLGRPKAGSFQFDVRLQSLRHPVPERRVALRRWQLAQSQLEGTRKRRAALSTLPGLFLNSVDRADPSNATAPETLKNPLVLRLVSGTRRRFAHRPLASGESPEPGQGLPVPGTAVQQSVSPTAQVCRRRVRPPLSRRLRGYGQNLSSEGDEGRRRLVTPQRARAARARRTVP